MRHALASATLIVGALALQTTVMSRVRVGGVSPDLVVLTVVAVAIRAGVTAGASYGFVAGFAVDLFLETPAGLTALSYTLIGYGIATTYAGLLRSIWWMPHVLAAVGSTSAALAFVVVGALVGQDQLLDSRVFDVSAMVAVYAVPCSLIVFPIVGRVFPAPAVS